MTDTAEPRRGRLATHRPALRDVGDVAAAVANDVHQRYPERLLVRGVVSECDWGPEAVTFVLVDVGPPDRPSRLHVSLDGLDFQSVAQDLKGVGLQASHLLADGQPVVLGGRLSLCVELGRLRLKMERIDFGQTESLMALRRQAALKALDDGGLLERQRKLPRPQGALRVAVIAAEGSPSHAAARDRLADSGFSIEQRLHPVAMEGHGAAAAIAGAVAAADRDGCDAILIVRDPATRVHQAVFDTQAVGEAIAYARAPVITGLGGGSELTVADEAAHAARPHAGDAAGVVVDWLEATFQRLERREARARKAAYGGLARARSHEQAAIARVKEAEAGARRRAAAAQGRKWRRLGLAVAACMLVAVIGLIALRPSGLVVAGVLAAIPAAVAGGAALGAAVQRRPSKEQTVPIEDLSFDDALAELDEVRELLEATDRPEDIQRLMQRADELSRHCRAVMGRAGEAIAELETA